MNKDIKVSIIVPVYNVRNYVGECLDSLEKQTFKEFEVLIVNDGSTDNSDDIVKEYCDKNDNFILINRKNGGLSAARNTGLEHAKGKYVYFLDSDDFLKKDAIERLYRKSEEENLDQLRFVAYSFEDGTSDYQWTREAGGYKYNGCYPDVMKGTDFYRKALDNNDYFPSCCLIFIKRSVIEDNNLRFYEGIIHEDNLFNFELTSVCQRVALLHEPLYYRRVRSNSITTNNNLLPKNKAMCISIEETDRFIECHQEIKDMYGIWQLSFFVSMMIHHWKQMNKADQESKESKEYFERIRPILKKYRIGGISLKLFYTNYHLYEFYNVVIGMFYKIIHRKNGQ
ncbi:glycosyltransferase [Butyrivibrio sp. NC3005]|uniref:glycosyltransferase n=1 Tax=Butyrivibrio sp. NC3005 TaxID=1280685 RepID=UPI00068582C3|nr:glycosyltransferase [Butyrivibrio sp. NC3005]